MNRRNGRKRATVSAPLPDVQVFLSRPTYQLGGTVVGTILIQQRKPLRKQTANADENGTANTATTTATTAGAAATAATTRPLRSILESVTVYVAGFCKIDARWHDYKSYTKIYGKEHPYLQLLQQGEGKFDSDLLEQSEGTVCFWATNGMEALDLPERTEGRRWNNNETDFQRGLRDDDYDDDDDDDDDDDNDIDSEKISDDENENRKNQKNQKSSKAKSKNGSKSSDFDASLHKDILAFTFRVDIPMDLPHSVYATTCRYYYTANVLVKTATQQQILKRNFRVVMPVFVGNNNNYNNNNDGRERNPGDELAVQSSARVKVGQCLGLAHSNGLPCHLSATEIHRPKGQLVVQQSYNHNNHNNHNNNNNNYYDVQTLRVSNTRGRPVCILTIVGSQTLSPGSRVHLQWDFPKQFRQPQPQKQPQKQQREQQQQPHNHRDNNNNNNTNDNNNGDRDDVRWIPCYQVCACLQGEEYAIYEDGSKKRTQSFLFDTCHEWVEPGVTDRVSKTLWLSSSGGGGGGGGDGAEGSVASHFEGGAPPCDLKTDVMEVSTWCRIDIAVCEQEETAGNNNASSSSGGGGGGAYNNLSLRIPCKVRHRSSFNCMQQQEQEMLEQQVPPLNELLDIEHKNEAFPIGDIRSDLKVLSLTMEDMVCGNDRATTSR